MDEALTFLNFAYGSNMWDAQMAKRCPQSKKIGVARLRGYRWIVSVRAPGCWWAACCAAWAG